MNSLENKRKENRSLPDMKLTMESEIAVTRWAIPRPSLTCSVSSIESSGRTPRGSTTTTASVPKSRSSSSSQGSNSNHSTHSASSGSLLLSAANLTKLNSTTNYQNNLTAYVHSAGSPEITKEEPTGHHDPFWNNVKLASAKNRHHDAESVASSTHFTVVNGFTRHNGGRKVDGTMWCCKSSHQITVLVVTMTILFMAGILAAICYVEMRQRRDLGGRFS